MVMRIPCRCIFQSIRQFIRLIFHIFANEQLAFSVLSAIHFAFFHMKIKILNSPFGFSPHSLWRIRWYIHFSLLSYENTTKFISLIYLSFTFYLIKRLLLLTINYYINKNITVFRLLNMWNLLKFTFCFEIKCRN